MKYRLSQNQLQLQTLLLFRYLTLQLQNPYLKILLLQHHFLQRKEQVEGLQ